MSYYRSFRIVIGTPLWRIYLQWAYKKCIEDLNELDFDPKFTKRGFTCLLCGAGNETTADEFIRFVIKRNPKTKIHIIDIGDEQIKAVRRLVKNKYPNLDIEVKKINALKLNTFIEKNSVDWIETDGLFEYFDKKSLRELLMLWRGLLTKDGFVTTRACASQGMIGRMIDSLRIRLGKVWPGVNLYAHNRQEVINSILKSGFKYTEGLTPIPTLRRYSLIKN